MNVIALRHSAVFMNAGSYVIRPKSSGPVLIWRRSIARMVPSWIGRSYFLPVRLSTIVSVSAIGVSVVSGFVVIVVGIGHRLRGNPIPAVRPARQVLELAALAAERPPLRIDGVSAAEDADSRRLAHPLILY